MGRPLKKARATARTGKGRARPRAPVPSRSTPLKVSETFRQFVLDQFEEFGDVHARAMFGGVGLYHEGVFFGIIAGDVLYLKVDAATRGEYVRAGMGPFTPYPERGGTMQYYAVPVDVLESASELTTWAGRAVKVAERAAAKSKKERHRDRMR